MMTNQLLNVTSNVALKDDQQPQMNTPARSSVKKIQVLITFSKNKQTFCPYQTYRQVAGSL